MSLTELRAKQLFTHACSVTGDNKVKCKMCLITLKDNRGHSNIKNHFENKHSGAADVQRIKILIEDGEKKEKDAFAGSMALKPVFSPEASAMFAWLNLIVQRNLPIYLVGDPVFCLATNMKKMSVNTFKKYAYMVMMEVEC